MNKELFEGIGSTNQRCHRQDLRDLFRSERQLKESSFKDFDPEAIAEYRRLRSIVKPAAVELKYTNIDLLKSLRAITTIDGACHPTVAGILLFGKEMIPPNVLSTSKSDRLYDLHRLKTCYQDIDLSNLMGHSSHLSPRFLKIL